MERGYFPCKKLRVTFRMGPRAAELQAQTQSGVCSFLLGDVRLGQHVPRQLCWQIHEVADSKEMGQLPTAGAQGCFGTQLQTQAVRSGHHLISSFLQPPQSSGPWHFDLKYSSLVGFLDTNSHTRLVWQVHKIHVLNYAL